MIRLIRPLLCFIVALAAAWMPAGERTAAAQVVPAAPFNTVTVVDTSADLNAGSNTQTCTFLQGAVFVPAADGCTLRRALREASARPDADRPIAIEFAPPPGEVVGGTWTLTINGSKALPPLSRENTLSTNGDVTIDGGTWTGARTTGPAIILLTNERSLEIESTGNTIRGLAFQGGGTIMLGTGAHNTLIEENWMGLSTDGQSIVFQTGQAMRMAGGGIYVRSDGNTVQNNVISGATAKAIDIDGGDNNVIQNNRIGTRGDGTVPDVAPASLCARSLTFDPQNWYGGWGISLSGSNNQIVDNRLAGLHIVQTQNSSPPVAIDIFGAGHTIEGNIIGVDSADKPVGVCGQGIKVAGSNMQIVDNTIVGSRVGFEDAVPTAILANDSSPLFDRITVRGNLVEDGPGGVYLFGPAIPESLLTFNPAKITSINGTTVQGTSGDNSPCGGCLIDFYRDDADGIGEALEHLGTTTAAPNGSFTFNLPQALPAGAGIRTSSTTQAANIIANYGAGMTTRVSMLYLALSEVTLTGPMSGTVGAQVAFTATVAPVGATTPLAFSVEATDFTPQQLSTNNPSVVATYTWATPGVKTVEVTVENDLGTVTATRQITIAAPPTDGVLYLPLTVK